MVGPRAPSLSILAKIHITNHNHPAEKKIPKGRLIEVEADKDKIVILVG